MSRRRLLILIVLLALFIFIWQVPAILKALPSRYAAAYLPESMQSLAERDHVEVLPTAAVTTDADSLLAAEEAQADGGEEDAWDESSQIEADLDVIVTTPMAEEAEHTSYEQVGGKETSQTLVEDLPPDSDPTPIPTTAPLIPTSSRLNSFKHQFQTWNNCGPATLAMGLTFFGIDQYQEQIAEILKPNPEDRNVNPWEMVDYVNLETDVSALYRVNGDIETIKRFIASGYPVIVELGLDPPGEYRWMGWYGHYLLLVAYDDDKDQFWVYDSWFGTSEVPAENADAEGREINYETLDRYWRQFNRSYIVLFDPEQAADVMKITGENVDDARMWQNALLKVREELAFEPENPYLWFNLGTIYNALKEYEKSAVAFDRARELGLPWRMLWYQFGPYDTYQQVGRYEDVVLLADVTLQDRPYFEEAYYYKGLALQALGNDSEAIENLESAARFNANFEAARIALDALVDKGG